MAAHVERVEQAQLVECASTDRPGNHGPAAGRRASSGSTPRRRPASGGHRRSTSSAEGIGPRWRGARPVRGCVSNVRPERASTDSPSTSRPLGRPSRKAGILGAVTREGWPDRSFPPPDGRPKGLLVDGGIGRGPLGPDVRHHQPPRPASSSPPWPMPPPTDVDRAVTAARRAFDGEWSRWTPYDRQRAVVRLADLVRRTSTS